MEGINLNTVYMVYCLKNESIALITESETTAKSMVFNDNGLEYSIYPPFTFVSNKVQPQLYETTLLEY